MDLFCEATSYNIGQQSLTQYKDKTQHVLLSYLQQRTTYETSIKPILLQLHKREISEDKGEQLLRHELMYDATAISLLNFYLRNQSMNVDLQLHPINVVDFEKVSCNDSEISDIMSHEDV